MKTEKIRLFIELREELDILSSRIFDYVKSKYENCLQFGKESMDVDFQIDEDGLEIEYSDKYYDLPTCAFLPPIPIDYLENEDSWKQFLDRHYEVKIAKQKEVENLKKEQEYQHYLKLKEKYEAI